MDWMHDLAKTIAFVWLASSSVPAWAAGGFVYDAAGSVSVAIGKTPPRPAVKNDTVVSGTVIRTGDNSHAVLKFEDGQVVSMQANSTFKVREYRYEPKQVEQNSIAFSMFKGGMRFITGLIGQRNPEAFRLATPNSTIGIRGTDFLVVMANKAAYSQVLSGSISMTNAAGTTILTAGQTALTPSAVALTTRYLLLRCLPAVSQLLRSCSCRDTRALPPPASGALTVAPPLQPPHQRPLLAQPLRKHASGYRSQCSSVNHPTGAAAGGPQPALPLLQAGWWEVFRRRRLE